MGIGSTLPNTMLTNKLEFVKRHDIGQARNTPIGSHLKTLLKLRRSLSNQIFKLIKPDFLSGEWRASNTLCTLKYYKNIHTKYL